MIGTLFWGIGRYYTDLRFGRERRLILCGIIALPLLFAVIALTYLRHPETEITSLPTPVEPDPPSQAAAAPTQPPSAMQVAADLILSNRSADAAPYLDVAEIELLRLRGIMEWKTGHLNAAREHFRAAIALSPKSIPDLCNLAAVELVLGDAAQASHHLLTASDLAPEDTFISNRLLLARIQAGAIEDVRREIRTQLETTPERSLPHVAAAAAAVELEDGNVTQAITFLEYAGSHFTPEVFQSLLSEAPLVKFSSKKEVADYYKPRNSPQHAKE